LRNLRSSAPIAARFDSSGARRLREA
jgi:hypothetical protein